MVRRQGNDGAAVTEDKPAEPAPAKPESDDGEEKKMTALDRARWVGAFVVGALALFLVSRSYLDPSAQVCRQEVGDGARAVTLCGPIGLEDALWVGLVGLVVILLLLKDFSEVSVTGIGSLKRTVEEAKKKTDEQAKKTAELERFVVGQFMSMSSHQTVNVTVVTSQGLKQARDEVPAPPESVTEDRNGLPRIDPERAVKLAQVLDLYEQMATIFSTITGERRHRFLDQSGRILIDHPNLLAWYREYKEPFNTFRAARAAAAHNPGSLSDDDLQTALELGQRLLFTMKEATRGIVPTDDSR